ncbi:hypothetical protein [Planotetraspora silvatica]|uniref:hypothetical protein n=1 Tax=Planotetraspora silvatica TaxID=234614 RepID=UPI00194F7A27|nr:hypothetical protein [Planotetraspora silvatica]
MQPPQSSWRRIVRGVGLVGLGWLAAVVMFSPDFANLPWSYAFTIAVVLGGLGLVKAFASLVLVLRKDWRNRGPA